MGDEAALSGIYNKFSYSLGQLHYDTNGFRQNNDLKHNIYNAFAQYEISPEVNVQAEYRHRETEHGDLELQGDPNVFDADYHRTIDQNSYRGGVRISPTQSSDLLFSFIHGNREEVNGKRLFDITKTYSYDGEMQYLFHSDNVNTVLGGGLYRTNNTRLDCTAPPCDLIPYNTTQYLAYLYSNYKPIKSLNLTGGLSYDHYRDNEVGAALNLSELNPKFGFQWKASKQISFRGAVFKSIKSAIIDNQLLQPTQIAGFNQFFDDTNGAVAWNYGVGMDTQLHKDVYAGVEAYKRDLKIATGPISQKPSEELYRLYLNWTLTSNWAFNSEFRFENFRSDGSFPGFPKFVETAYLPTEIRYTHSSGFFSALKGTFVNQRVRLFDGAQDGFNSNFYLVDAAIGYRFPKQYGLLSLEAKNLFDSSFKYRDRQFQQNEQRSPDFFPERMLFGRITLNF